MVQQTPLWTRSSVVLDDRLSQATYVSLHRVVGDAFELQCVLIAVGSVVAKPAEPAETSYDCSERSQQAAADSQEVGSAFVKGTPIVPNSMRPRSAFFVQLVREMFSAIY